MMLCLNIPASASCCHSNRRLNEYVCPELARRVGLADSGYDRQEKVVGGSNSVMVRCG